MAPTAVGHMVEALATANGYKRANPELDVHLLVNERTAVELAGCCPWLGGVHAVDREAPRFDRVPSEWDYVIHDDRRPSEVAADYLAQARSHLRARVATGTIGDHTLPFDRRPSLRLELPADARRRAEALCRSGGTQIAVTLAGAGDPTHYPSADAWSLILDAIAFRYPELTVHLIGKLATAGHPSTTAVPRSDVDALLARHEFCRDRFDIGLFDQLAVIERCSVMISPHTGLAFAALAVGTPWLAISGGRWPEFFHTGVPFYSVLPDPRKYPAFGPGFDALAEDGRIVSMCRQRIGDDLARIVEGAAILIERRWSFRRCLDHYEASRAKLYGR